MKLLLRNCTSAPLTLFIEPYCEEHEIPPEGEAIVILGDDGAHSLDYHPENLVTLWDDGENFAVVEIISKQQKTVIDALGFTRGWLFQYGVEGKQAAKDLDAVIEREEKNCGYLRSRFEAYRAFREGFCAKSTEDEPKSANLPTWTGRGALADTYRAGGVAAYFNYRTRIEPGLVELGKAPFDTDTALQTFNDADAMIASAGASQSPLSTHCGH